MRITPASALLVVWGPQEVTPVKRWAGCPSQDTRDWESVPYRESRCAVHHRCPPSDRVCILFFPRQGLLPLHLFSLPLPLTGRILPPPELSQEAPSWSSCLVPRLPPSILFLMGLPETPLTDTPAKAGISRGPPFPSCSLRSRSLTLYHDVAPSVFIAHEHTLQAVKWQMKVSSVTATPTRGGGSPPCACLIATAQLWEGGPAPYCVLP